MPDLLSLGAAATGLGSLGSAIGGLFGAKKSNKDARRMFQQQMDESIQRRVADAKKAGIHPLFALGASVGASPTLMAGQSTSGSALGEGIAEAGRTLTRYASAKADRTAQAAMQAASIRSANASATRDEAEAMLAASQAKKLQQELTSRGHDGFRTFPAGVKPYVGGEELAYGPAEVEMARVPTSKATGLEAGNPPSQRDYVLPDGRTVRLNTSGMELDEIKQIDYVYQRAIHKATDAMVAIRRKLEELGLAKRLYTK